MAATISMGTWWHARHRAIYRTTRKLMQLLHKSHNVCASSTSLQACRRNMDLFSRMSVGHCQQRSMSSSALYDSTIIDYDDDLEHKLKNTSSMDRNIKLRKMEWLENVNVYKLSSDYMQLMTLAKEKEELEQERKEITDQMKNIVKNKLSGQDFESQKEQLTTRGRAVRETLRAISKDYNNLQELVVCYALKLPNYLHKSVPSEDTVLEQCGRLPKFEYNIVDHLELGRRRKTIFLSEASPGSYYLTGDLAECEQQLVAMAAQKLDDMGLMPVRGPDIVKSIVLEGCGRDLDYPKNIFTLMPKLSDQTEREQAMEHKSKWDTTYHLTGASPMVFAAFLTKMAISESSLPLKTYNIGRYYSRRNMKNYPKQGLFAAPQAMHLETCSIGRTEEEADELYETMVQQIWQLHMDLQLPLRLVNLEPANLRSCERCKTEVQVWMPSQRQFLPVAWASIYGDYLSRRLMMQHTSSKNLEKPENSSHIHTVHGTAMCVPRLIAAYMENTQTQLRKYSVPTF